MQDTSVSESDSEPRQMPQFSAIERVVLASGACALSIWLGGLAWVGYKIVVLII